MLFVSDLDGTLFDHTHDIDDVVLAGIKEVLAKGHYFVICTGRGMQGEGNVNFGIRHDHIYTIALNGALTYDGNAELIARRPIDKEIIKAFYHDLDDVLVRYESSDFVLCPFTLARVDAYLEKEGFFERVWKFKKEDFIENTHFGTSLDEILANDIFKLDIIVSHPDRKEKTDAILARYSDKLVNAPWGEGFYDITDIAVDKSVSVKALVDELGITDKDIFVYGDSYNDVRMLDMFSNSASPSNANAAAKAVAKRIIGDYDDHSVIKDILAKI